jgi:hypothetical protein
MAAAVYGTDPHHVHQLSSSDILPLTTTAQRFGTRVFALAEAGLLAQRREHSREIWTLTASGRRRLRRA